MESDLIEKHPTAMEQTNGALIRKYETFAEDVPNVKEIPKLSDFEEYRITDVTDIPAPLPVVKIGGEIISTSENITTFSGESKSGKSAVSSMIIASAISRNADIPDAIEVLENIDCKAVLHFDTEQSRYKHQGNIKSILKRGKLLRTPPNFLSYNIRKLDLDKYEEVTSNICKAAATEMGGIFLIVIDGIADYIASVNDEEESKRIVKYFEGIAIQYQCPIIVIIHTNPGGNKERGHLGSEIQRKAESVIMVVPEGDYSYIQPKYLRNAGRGDIPQIQFRYDKDLGYHTDYGVKSTETVSASDKKAAMLEKVVNEIFKDGGAIPYGELIKEIMKKTNKGERTAKNYLTDIKGWDLVTQNTDGKYVMAGNDGEDIPF